MALQLTGILLRVRLIHARFGNSGAARRREVRGNLAAATFSAAAFSQHQQRKAVGIETSSMAAHRRLPPVRGGWPVVEPDRLGTSVAK